MQSPRLLAAVVALGLSACAQPHRSLYMWETYPRQQYVYLLREGMSADQQIQEIEAHAEKARAANAQLPPGLRAHLGMLYLSVGNPGRAMELWNAEKVAFPESTPYMDQLLKRLEAPKAEPTKTEHEAKEPAA
jgi:hypothetical protein